MLAEIVSGERDWSDVLFLIAAILAVVAAWNAWPQRKLDGVLGWIAVAVISVAWLLL